MGAGRTHHVVCTAAVPNGILERTEPEDARRARSWLLSQSWYERRRIEWTCSASVDPTRGQSQVRHHVVLDLDCPNSAKPASASLRFTAKLSVRRGEEPREKARRVLDLPRRATSERLMAKAQGGFEHRSFCAVRGNSVIGPLPADWPIERMLTAYSSHLGSYGQGGVGLSGWQCNGGSWIVLPLKGSDGWIWLTREEIEPAEDFRALNIVIDQRIVGAHPGQIGDFPTWEHRYAGHHQILDMPDFADEKPTLSRFEASGSGFTLEAANGLTRWRFAMGDDLPRPVWAGSGEPRLLREANPSRTPCCSPTTAIWKSSRRGSGSFPIG